jgi:hypothetical protein
MGFFSIVLNFVFRRACFRIFTGNDFSSGAIRD